MTRNGHRITWHNARKLEDMYYKCSRCGQKRPAVKSYESFKCKKELES